MDAGTHRHTGAQGFDVQDGVGDISLERDRSTTQLQVLSIDVDRASARSQFAHSGKFVAAHQNMHLADQAGIDSITGQIEPRRWEEHLVGKTCAGTFKSRWYPYY